MRFPAGAQFFQYWQVWSPPWKRRPSTSTSQGRPPARRDNKVEALDRLAVRHQASPRLIDGHVAARRNSFESRLAMVVAIGHAHLHDQPDKPYYAGESGRVSKEGSGRGSWFGVRWFGKRVRWFGVQWFGKSGSWFSSVQFFVHCLVTRFRPGGPVVAADWRYLE